SRGAWSKRFRRGRSRPAAAPPCWRRSPASAGDPNRTAPAPEKVSCVAPRSLPGPVVGTQGGLRAFGKAVQHLPPAGFDRIALRCLEVAVQRGAPDAGDLLDIGRAALAALDLHRGDTDG